MSFAINSNLPQSNIDYIHTEIIKPIAINDQRDGAGSCTFIFRPIGTLDLQTAVKIPVLATNDNQNLPINIGIGSIIKSATLRSNGGVIILQNNEFPNWCNIKNSFVDTDKKKRVVSAKHGYLQDFNPSEAGSLNAQDQNNPYNVLGKLSLDLQYTHASPPLEAGGVISRGNSNYVITTDKSSTLQAVVSLEDLFPYAKDTLYLPLNMIDQEISLVLEWTHNGQQPKDNERSIMKRAGCPYDANDATTHAYIDIVTDEVELLVDYVVFKNESMMAQQINSPQGKVLHYGDMEWSTFSMQGLAATANARNRKVYNFNLTAVNKNVRQMYLLHNIEPTTNPQDAVSQLYTAPSIAYGKWASRAVTDLEDGEKFNLRINNQLVFQESLTNDAQKITELEEAMGSKYMLPMSAYNNLDSRRDELDGGALGGDYIVKGLISQVAQLEGFAQNQCITGNTHIIGVNLEKSILMPDGSYIRRNIPGSGLKIGEAPINIDFEVLHRQNKNNDKRLVKVLCIVEKNLILKNGNIMVLES